VISVLSLASPPIVDTNGQEIWTVNQYDGAWRNPLATCAKGTLFGDNDYVTEQWSAKYFIACKKNAALVKTAVANAWKHATLKNTFSSDFSTSKHLLNACLVTSATFVNIEIGNFLRGLIGIGFSTGKAVLHTGASASYLGIGLIRLLSGETKDLGKALDHAIKTCKDLLSFLTCLGHAIPSWLPLALTLIFPHIGLAALAGCALLTIGSRFTGLSDLVGYGGTAGFLKSKAWHAQKVLDDANATPEAKAKAKKVVEDWKYLKHELHPLKSGEGAMLASFGLHVLLEASLMPIECVVPGFSSIALPFFGLFRVGLASAISDGIPALAWAGLAYQKKRNESQALNLFLPQN